MSGENPTSVAVVGGGVAGLTAARTLQTHGYRVTVFDKGRRVGGRICARVRNHAAFDHGAQYFTTRDPRFREVVDAGLASNALQRWDGRIVALNPDGLSTSSPQTRYVGTPAMHALADLLAEGLSIHSSTRVVGLRREPSGWQLLDEHGALLTACEAVVLALPAPQASEMLGPDSPLAALVLRCQFQPCWAVMVQFEAPLALPFDGAFVIEAPLSWIARNNAKPDRPASECWVLHAGPRWSCEHLEDDPHSVAEQLTAAMAELLAKRLRFALPQPIAQHAHRWRFALPIDPLEEGFLLDAQSKVMVCGDYCHGARVEGAYLSGLKAAERLALILDRV